MSLNRYQCSLVVVCVLAGVLTVGCVPAWGLVGRGHVFGFAFEGAGEAALVDPSGVAVDEATGEVLVVDAGAERVERFRPGGAGGFEFVSSFRVDSPGAIAVDNAPGSPSRGDVYVAGSEEPGEEGDERDFLYKFTADGEKLFKHSVFKAKEGSEPVELELEGIRGLSVDANGTLWVYWEEEGVISAFSSAEANRWEPVETVHSEVLTGLSECGAADAFAVAPDDEGFEVGYERENAAEECPGEEGLTPDPVVVGKLSADGALLARETDRQNTTGVAVDPVSGDVYMDNGGSVASYTPEGVLVQRFGAGQLRGGAGVAVDGGTGEVFAPQSAAHSVEAFVPEGAGAPVVDGVSAKAVSAGGEELAATIDPDGSATEYFFEYGTSDCALTGSGCARLPMPAGEIAPGYGDQTVTVVVGGLRAATAYYYRVQASNGVGGPVVGTPSPNMFQTLPSASGLPDGRAWEMVSPPDKHGAQIEAQPLNGAMIVSSLDGDALTWVANGPVVTEPQGSRSPELAQLLSVRGEQGWESQSLETPHDQGQGIEAEPVPDEYQDFSSDLALSVLSPAVPVAPGEPRLGLVEAPPLSPQASEKTIYLRDDPPLQAEPSEQAAYQQAGSEPNRAYLYPGYQPLVDAANDTSGQHFGGGLVFQGATPDLAHVVFSSSASLLSGLPGSGELYEWSPSDSLAPVSVLPDGTAASDPFLGDGEGQSSSPGLNARNAISSDGSLVYFTDGKEHLYLRDTQTGETIQVNAAQGNDATEPGPGGQTLIEPGEEQQETHFQTATSDATKVFFTDTARLSEDSTVEPVEEGQGPADLYEFELTSKPGEALRGRLNDLTPEAAEDSADVLNLIPGAGEDGGYVYFVANGVLAQGATPGHCPRYYGEETPPPTGATCNLYVSEPDPQAPGQRQTRFIAALSDEDGADWGAGLTSHFLPSQDLATVTSRVSPNGQYLAFMSERSLTGYDNEDISSQHPGERMDEEVYLYDAETQRLLCASCNPSGARPTGVYDKQKSGEGLGLLVDRSENWSGHWLAGSLPAWTLAYGHFKSPVYQPRYLDSSGRLFFDSPDALVPQVNTPTRQEEVAGEQQQDVGVENVYQYEPEAVGSCQSSAGCVGLLSSGTSSRESAFLDASENGENAFFLTSAPLLPQDQDQAFDIYDARVCTTGSPCLSLPERSAPPCDSTSSCHGPASAPAGQAPLPPSMTYSGPRSIVKQGVSASKTSSRPKPVLSRAQKLALGLKACRKDKHKHKRKRKDCEAKARARYGAKAKKTRKGGVRARRERKR